MKKLLILILLLASSFSVNAQTGENIVRVSESIGYQFYIDKSTVIRGEKAVRFLYLTYDKSGGKLETLAMANCIEMQYSTVANGIVGMDGRVKFTDVEEPKIESAGKGTNIYKLIKYACSYKPNIAKPSDGKNVNYAVKYKDEWLLIDEDALTYINPARIQRIDGELYFWAKREFPKEPAGVAYQLMYKRIDCNAMSSNRIQLVSYSSDGRVLKTVNPPNPIMEVAIPESVGEFMLQKICKYAK